MLLWAGASLFISRSINRSITLFTSWFWLLFSPWSFYSLSLSFYIPDNTWDLLVGGAINFFKPPSCFLASSLSLFYSYSESLLSSLEFSSSDSSSYCYDWGCPLPKSSKSTFWFSNCFFFFLSSLSFCFFFFNFSFYFFFFLLSSSSLSSSSFSSSYYIFLVFLLISLSIFCFSLRYFFL